jgi:hypothetical protein
MIGIWTICAHAYGDTVRSKRTGDRYQVTLVTQAVPWMRCNHSWHAWITRARKHSLLRCTTSGKCSIQTSQLFFLSCSCHSALRFLFFFGLLVGHVCSGCLDCAPRCRVAGAAISHFYADSYRVVFRASKLSILD